VFWLRYDVFLSYSHKDSAKVNAFASALRARGYRIFCDTESLVIGERWKERLSGAIRRSRVCILCWSESSKSSEVVTYEYSRAEGLRKPLLPWLLDSTPLPQMIEIQGVTLQDPAQAVGQFVPRLGWSLARLRWMLTALLLPLFVVAALGIGRWLQPPPPYRFTGHVVDRETRLPLEGVEVDAEDHQYTTRTDVNGVYVLLLPQPRPKYLHLVFAKENYRGEDAVTVSPDHPFDTDMTRLNPANR
jgi:TIR domain-containing protein